MSSSQGIDQSPDNGWAAPGVRPTGLLDVAGRVDELAGGFVAGADLRSDGSLLVGLRQLIDQLEALWLTAAGQFEAAGGPADDGAITLAGWLRHHYHIAPGEASARAKVAHQITAGELQVTSDAMRDGSISWRHGDVINQTLHDLPPEHRKQAEQILVEPAKSVDPLLLKRLGQEVLHRLDVDKAEQAAVRRLERRGVTLAETYDGMVAINGLLDPVTGATVLTAINAHTRPSRGDLTDDRSWPQRRADALAEICQQWLNFADTPTVAGARPHLSVIVDLPTLTRASGVGPAELSFAGPITAEQARQLACDAAIARVITNGPSQILDVGRTTRTIPPAVRRAVTVRDRHCVASGCHQPAHHCDVHHIHHWADGGRTELGNLVLLCRRHHTQTHQRGWQITRGRDGSLTLARPNGRPPPD